MLLSLLLQIASPQWVVDDVVPPDPVVASDQSFQWVRSVPLGDLTGSGRSAFMNKGARNIHGPVFNQILSGNIASGFGLPNLSFDVPRIGVVHNNWYSYFGTGTSVLKSPQGLLAAVVNQPQLMIANLSNGQFQGRVDPPIPGGGLLPLAQWDSLHNAGDINQDGNDDLLYYGHPSPGLQWGTYIGLLDGATFQSLWQTYLPDGWLPTPIFPTDIGEWQDIDGDLVPDMVIGNTLWYLQTTQLEGYVAALSGLDGSIIWENLNQALIGGSGKLGSDLTGDGIRDVFVAGEGDQIELINGSNGQTIWNKSVQDFVPWLPLGFVLPTFDHPPMFGPVNSNGFVNELYIPVLGNFPGEAFEHQYIFTLDPLTGVILRMDTLPYSFEPWAPDTIGALRMPALQYLGDIDRDGLPEIARAVNTPSYSPPNWPGWADSNIVMGQETLDFPTQLPLNGNHTAHIAIPGAAGRSGQLLFSNDFHREDGFTPDGWRTGLVSNGLLDWSKQQALGVSLDASGNGHLSFQLPNKPGLIGQMLYARFIVPDVIDPGTIWTMSSLGIGQVIP